MFEYNVKRNKNLVFRYETYFQLDVMRGLHTELKCTYIINTIINRINGHFGVYVLSCLSVPLICLCISVPASNCSD